MKNFSNYNDYSTKEELHFESKAVHGALGTEPLTGAVSMADLSDGNFPSSGTWGIHRICVQSS